MKNKIVKCDKCHKEFTQKWVAAKKQWSQISEVNYWTNGKKWNGYEKLCRSCLKNWYEENRETFNKLVDKDKQKVFLRYKYNGYLDKSDSVDNKDEIEHNINKVVENYLRNKEWLDWFLKRHEDFLSSGDYVQEKNNSRKLIAEYFTTREQKIISCDLSSMYMHEKFSGCLSDAPNLSLDQFQELCFLWWVSLFNEYPILASKGRINEAEKKKMYKLVAEKKLEKTKIEMRNNLSFLLEQYLRENELPTPEWYFDYQKEEDAAKRAELYKKGDTHAKKYRENRIIKTKEFYKKNKDKYPELKNLIESELKEEERVIKNLEEQIKNFNYLKWSESYKIYRK